MAMAEPAREPEAPGRIVAPMRAVVGDTESLDLEVLAARLARAADELRSAAEDASQEAQDILERLASRPHRRL